MWTFLAVGVSVGLLSSIATGALIDTNYFSYSEACKLTDAICDYSNNKAEACTFLKSNPYRECYVRIGFCTEQEFASLTSEICKETRAVVPVSEAKTNFYKAFANVSPGCGQKGAYCMVSTVISIVFKQQEQYCFLMNVNTNYGTSELCLTTGDPACTPTEFGALKKAACSVNVTTASPFAEALWKTSAVCKGKISDCAERSAEAKRLVGAEQYCDSLNINGTAETCFKEDGACTAEEFSMLKAAACVADVTSPTPGTTLTSVTTHRPNAATTPAWNIYVRMLFLALICFVNHN